MVPEKSYTARHFSMKAGMIPGTTYCRMMTIAAGQEYRNPAQEG
jgi:hypothetical protein